MSTATTLNIKKHWQIQTEINTPCGCGAKKGMVCMWVAGKTVWYYCYSRSRGRVH